MHLRLRHRWMVVIVGEESGNVTPLAFVRFRMLDNALSWVRDMNDRNPDIGTHFEVRRVGDGDPPTPCR
jgi:hypothetical protein